ncbi:hypothetical protein PQX77_014794 [Marasmius sp. AFHP31]|nr:hypothetical protein PQX77_014794 [Marasmius sp. AFHP31]
MNSNLMAPSNQQQPHEVVNGLNHRHTTTSAQAILALIDPNYTRRDTRLHSQIQLITPEVLEVSELKKQNTNLQTQLFQIIYAHGLPPASSPPQSSSTLPSAPSGPPASSSSTSSVEAPTTNVSRRKKHEDTNVTWWMCPPSTNKAPTKLVDAKDEASGSSYSVYAWMQEENGSLISLSTKQQVYQDHHGFWTEQGLMNPPDNYSSLKPSQMDAFIAFIEPKHTFLTLCNGHWKAHELVKNNYKSWRTTWSRHKGKEDKEKLDKKEKDKVEKKRKKEKEEGREKDKEVKTSKQRDNRSVKSSLLVINITDSDSKEVCLFFSLSFSVLKPASQETQGAVKNVVNGNLSSKKLGPAIVFANVDVEKLAIKATANLSAPVTPPADNSAQASDSPVVPAAAAFVPVDFIQDLEAKVKALPKSIPTAKKDHVFSCYTVDLNALTSAIDDENLWPTFDKPLTQIIPVGDYDTRKHLVVRGKYGLPAFVALVRHLVYTRKMDSIVLKPKLERLVETIDRAVAVAGKASEQLPAKKSRKRKANDVPSGTNQVTKRSKAAALPLQIPDLISPKWLFAADWKSVSGNEFLPEVDFQAAWVALEKGNKAKLKHYQELLRKRNAEVTSAVSPPQGATV